MDAKTALSAALATLALSASAWKRLPDRDIYEANLTAAPGAEVLALDLGSANARIARGRVLKAFVVHLRDGSGEWRAAPEIPPAKNGSRVYIPLDSFAGCAGAPAQSFTKVRVSAWGTLTSAALKAKKLPASGKISASLVKPTTGVVAPGLPRARILERIGAPVRFFEPSDMDGIRKFCAGGGKIVVGHCDDPGLAAFMGVKPGAWTRVDSAALVSPSGTTLATYETGGAHPPSLPGGANALHARVAATLYDPHMRPTGVAGAIETDRGVWYANAIPPAPMRKGGAKPPSGVPVRGVWSTGMPLDPKGWDGMAARLAAAGFNTLFIRSDSPYFDSALRACKKRKIAVHAWFIAFGETKRSPDSAKDRAAVRRDAIALVRKGVDGVELDYFRYGTGELKTPKRKEQGTKRLTSLLRLIAEDVKAANPEVELSVAVFPRPSSQAAVGQDAKTWTDENLVSFVSPMCYTENAVVFASMVLENGRPGKTVIGIGSGANESRLDATQLNTQMQIAKRAKLRGFAVFRLDAELAARLAPQKKSSPFFKKRK